MTQFCVCLLSVVTLLLTPLTIYNTVQIQTLQNHDNQDVANVANCAWRQTQEDCHNLLWCKWDGDHCVRSWIRKSDGTVFGPTTTVHDDNNN